MTLQNWADNGWLRSHKTSRQEIGNLLDIGKRDLRDSRDPGLSADWRFGISYNAALKLCTILMYAEGFRPEKPLAHSTGPFRLFLSYLGQKDPMMRLTSTDAGRNETPWNTTTWVEPQTQTQTSLSNSRKNSKKLFENG